MRYRDLSGNRSGRLLIQGRDLSIKKRDAYWVCLCDCGNTVSVSTTNLLRTKSCGCIITDSRKHKDVIGVTSGRLIILEELGTTTNNGSSYRMMKCVCLCGNIVIKRLTSFFYKSDRSGLSCGCLKGISSRERHLRNPDTQKRKHPLYGVWKGMKSRCNNPENIRYKNYGGRGILVCEEWEHNYIVFYDWAMENGYKEGLEIDRIDNDGIYEPKNCQFTDDEGQANNRTTTVYVFFNGTKTPLTLACRKLKVNPSLVRQRMNRNGYSFEEAAKQKIR